ncbi:uncharacterized protein LOC131575103 isoform X2 [Poecile atricapillus]|uniref:uncharacterized protein LOC131575103 isoform X2 n=2 Tax=Poecile atricapillus TaxID=48891 RepID=UPI0027387459|nr:uncharacterized protein LOC131575103 isoform X2 [Poecile atricapillus]
MRMRTGKHWNYSTWDVMRVCNYGIWPAVLPAVSAGSAALPCPGLRVLLTCSFFSRLRELPHVQPLFFLGAEGPKPSQVFSSELLWDEHGAGWRLGEGTLHTTPMACNNICRPCGPTPLANSCNEPCALQCQDSRVVIQPSPVQVTLPGPIMTSFPQNTAVGSTSSAAVGTELSVQGQPISGGFGGFGGFGYGRGFGYGLGCGYGLGGLGCYGRRGGYIC